MYSFLVEDGASIKAESTIVPFFRFRYVSTATTYANKRCCNWQIAESLQSVSVCYLITGLNNAEICKGLAVNYFSNRGHVRKIVQILNHLDSKSSFPIVELIATFPFVIARTYEGNPLSPRNYATYLCQIFLRPHLSKFITQVGQTHLLIQEDNISRFACCRVIWCFPVFLSKKLFLYKNLSFMIHQGLLQCNRPSYDTDLHMCM